MADAVQPTVTLDSDTASKLTKKVLESYLNVLKDGGMSYVPSDTDAYMSGELNMINNDMKKIFSIEKEPAADDILAAQPADAIQRILLITNLQMRLPMRKNLTTKNIDQ